MNPANSHSLPGILAVANADLGNCKAFSRVHPTGFETFDLLDPIDQLTPKFCAVRQYHSIYQLGLILTNWH